MSEPSALEWLQIDTSREAVEIRTLAIEWQTYTYRAGKNNSTRMGINSMLNPLPQFQSRYPGPGPAGGADKKWEIKEIDDLNANPERHHQYFSGAPFPNDGSILLPQRFGVGSDELNRHIKDLNKELQEHTFNFCGCCSRTDCETTCYLMACIPPVAIGIGSIAACKDASFVTKLAEWTHRRNQQIAAAQSERDVFGMSSTPGSAGSAGSAAADVGATEMTRIDVSAASKSLAGGGGNKKNVGRPYRIVWTPIPIYTHMPGRLNYSSRRRGLGETSCCACCGGKVIDYELVFVFPPLSTAPPQYARPLNFAAPTPTPAPAQPLPTPSAPPADGNSTAVETEKLAAAAATYGGTGTATTTTTTDTSSATATVAAVVDGPIVFSDPWEGIVRPASVQAALERMGGVSAPVRTNNKAAEREPAPWRSDVPDVIVDAYNNHQLRRHSILIWDGGDKDGGLGYFLSSFSGVGFPLFSSHGLADAARHTDSDHALKRARLQAAGITEEEINEFSKQLYRLYGSSFEWSSRYCCQCCCDLAPTLNQVPPLAPDSTGSLQREWLAAYDLNRQKRWSKGKLDRNSRRM